MRRIFDVLPKKGTEPDSIMTMEQKVYSVMTRTLNARIYVEKKLSEKRKSLAIINNKS